MSAGQLVDRAVTLFHRAASGLYPILVFKQIRRSQLDMAIARGEEAIHLLRRARGDTPDTRSAATETGSPAASRGGAATNIAGQAATAAGHGSAGQDGGVSGHIDDS